MKILLILALLAAENETDLTRKYEADVRTLSADEMEGRGLGTRGLARAADYLETRLRESGLDPAFGDSYRQSFLVKTGVSLQPGNSLSGTEANDWTPLGFSSSGTFSGELVFAGYGIEAPAIGYNDFENLNLKGKVALMLRYEPQERDDASPFDGRRPSRWSSMRYKTLKARERGAVAVIFVTGPRQDEEKDKLPGLANDGPESAAGIPVLQIRTSVAQKWLTPSGIDLAEFQDAVDRDLRPRSRPTKTRVDGKATMKTSTSAADNVAGIIRGKGTLSRQVVVVGAHYDHLGYGGAGSMRPNEHAIHNGADDNASGTAAVLLAGERLRSLLADSPNHRTIVISLFAAEEVGLGGSSWFVRNPPYPLENVVAMINLDMVGQLRDEKLVALGVESAPEWNDAVTRAATDTGLQITMRGDGYGPSDQTSFYAQRIPVLHFFTGTHDRYHTPSDDADSLNYAGGTKIALLTANLARDLALGNFTPTYARSSSAPAMSGDSRGYGAYLGTVPDYTAMEASSGGVLLSDVRPKSPADLAGIRGGDRIIEIAGTRIENLYDMTYALQDHRPGETVDVVVVRNNAKVTLRATLTARGAAPSTPQPATPSPSPHSLTPAPAEKTSSFYDGRPGKDFTIQAGQKFDRRFDNEPHLTDVRQLTFSGENAEAYFSPDGKQLIYQTTLEEGKCDQQYVLDLATGEKRLVSTGKGRTTCGYFDWPESDRIVYASTHGKSADCPPPPDRSQGYIWGLYDYDIYEAPVNGGPAKVVTAAPGYDAEATWCHRGGKMVFTSSRDGDLDLYEMNEAGEIRRLTNTPGYDGGAFYSADCSEIVWRASRPTGADLEQYKQLLAQELVRPQALEIFVMNADGSNVRQVTSNAAANFGPYFHPDGNQIIYSSNAGENPREFDLWMVEKTGGTPRRITTAPGFDGFPMFSPDGNFVVWGSNRANPAGRSTNLFIARWLEEKQN